MLHEPDGRRMRRYSCNRYGCMWPTVKDGLLEISLQKSSAGIEPNFTCEIRNWLAGAQDLNFYLLSQSGLRTAGENFALSGV